MRVLLAHLRRVLGIPVDDIVFAQDYDVTFPFALVGLLNENGKDELVQVVVELFFGSFVAQLVQESAWKKKNRTKRWSTSVVNWSTGEIIDVTHVDPGI